MKTRLLAMLVLGSAMLLPAVVAARPAPPAQPSPAPVRRSAARAERPLPRGEYTMRGEVNVLSASPWNPAGKDRLGTRVVARMERASTGAVVVILSHAPSGQSCRFEAGPFGRNTISITPQQSCRFTALSSPGSLRISNGWLEEKKGRLRFEGRMEIEWLMYRGSISVAVEGPRKR